MPLARAADHPGRSHPQKLPRVFLDLLPFGILLYMEEKTFFKKIFGPQTL